LTVVAATTRDSKKCIATGELLPESELVRFVLAPDGTVVPDVAATLPGRGIWVRASRAAIETSEKRNLFAKAAGRAATCEGLALRTEQLLVKRILADLGLARRAGVAVLGFDNIVRALRSPSPPAAIFEARDGSPDGRRKLASAARAANIAIEIVACLDNEEMSLALGRENVVHAALKSGRLAERLVTDASRLKGLRSTGKDLAGSSPAADESC